MTAGRIAAVAALAGLALGVVTIVALLAWAFSPILPTPAPESRPLPASTAPPAPLTSIPLTAVPMHLRGPR